MPTPTEIQRLAAATNALRPDWPVTSLVTFLTRNHADRAYQDLAVALTVIATDPATQTPARINNDGPWWHTVNSQPPARVGTPCPDHEGRQLGRCPECDALAAPPPAVFLEAKQQLRRPTTTKETTR